MVSHCYQDTEDSMSKSQPRCGSSTELETREGSTFPDIWLPAESTTCGESGGPFVFLTMTVMASMWTPVRVFWVGEAISVWQVYACTHSRCKNAGLVVACNSSVMFHAVYFYWAFLFEIQNHTKLCGWGVVANNTQLFLPLDLWEKKWVFVITVSGLYFSLWGFEKSKTIMLRHGVRVLKYEKGKIFFWSNSERYYSSMR